MSTNPPIRKCLPPLPNSNIAFIAHYFIEKHELCYCFVYKDFNIKYEKYYPAIALL